MRWSLAVLLCFVVGCSESTPLPGVDAGGDDGGGTVLDGHDCDVAMELELGEPVTLPLGDYPIPLRWFLTEIPARTSVAYRLAAESSRPRIELWRGGRAPPRCRERLLIDAPGDCEPGAPCSTEVVHHNWSLEPEIVLAGITTGSSTDATFEVVGIDNTECDRAWPLGVGDSLEQLYGTETVTTCSGSPSYLTRFYRVDVEAGALLTVSSGAYGCGDPGCPASVQILGACGGPCLASSADREEDPMGGWPVRLDNTGDATSVVVVVGAVVADPERDTEPGPELSVWIR